MFTACEDVSPPTLKKLSTSLHVCTVCVYVHDCVYVCVCVHTCTRMPSNSSAFRGTVVIFYPKLNLLLSHFFFTLSRSFTNFSGGDFLGRVFFFLIFCLDNGLFQLHPHGGVNVALPLKKAKLVEIRLEPPRFIKMGQ